MTLYINTTQGDDIAIAIKDGEKIIAQKKFKAKYSQAEKLLPMIDKILARNKIKVSNIKKIQVANKNGNFTALRIGVVTANALGYALGVPVQNIVENKKFKVKSRKFDFDIVEPVYSKEPNITKKITDSR